MYLNYYNLKLKPFQISPDPKFLWLGGTHKKAFNSLKYGILGNKGFMLLTGDFGMGKTTLVNALVDSLKNDIIFAILSEPNLKKLDFFFKIADMIQMNKNFNTKGEFLIHLKHFLNNLSTKEKEVVLLFKNAQSLNQRILEDIRLLSNIEISNKKLITIIFVGENKLYAVLKKNEALRQRVTINCDLKPLIESETDEYIIHRLKVAGSEQTIFSPNAIREIFSFSGGNPRLINTICDLALTFGFKKKLKIIELEIIRECALNLKLLDQPALIEIKNEKMPSIEYRNELEIAEPETIRERDENYKLLDQFDRNENEEAYARIDKIDEKITTKVRTNTLRRKIAYFATAALVILACVLGYDYYFRDHKASFAIREILPTKASIPLSKTESETTTQKYDEIVILKSDTAGSKSKPMDANNPNASAGAQLNQLKAHNEELDAAVKELKSTKARIIELDSAVLEREKLLSQTEQKLTEMTKELKQEKKSKALLQTELASKAALIAKLQKIIDGFKSSVFELESEVDNKTKEISMLKDRLQDLDKEYTSADDQLSQLKTRNEELYASVRELESAKARIVKLDSAALEQEQLLSQTEQKLTELAKELKQEKKSKELLQAELSAKTDSVAKLKEMLNVAESNVIRSKDEIQKRKKEIEKLQDQITRLKIQKTASESPPAVVRPQEKLPTRKEAFETETEPPSPADIIDWVIKKKSEE